MGPASEEGSLVCVVFAVCCLLFAFSGRGFGIAVVDGRAGWVRGPTPGRLEGLMNDGACS